MVCAFELYGKTVFLNKLTAYLLIAQWRLPQSLLFELIEHVIIWEVKVLHGCHGTAGRWWFGHNDHASLCSAHASCLPDEVLCWVVLPREPER